MDYEKKYKEALEDMRVIYPNLKGDARLAVEHAFPELHEGDDSWYIEELKDFLDTYGEDYFGRGEWQIFVDWLEKQKEYHIPWYDYQKSKEAGYTIVPNEEYKQLIKQKGLPLMNGDSDAYFDEWNLQQQNPTKRQCFEEGIRYAQRLQEEQKPILEVFGFKVGDAVRLKDGDGRKHIIKSFEEVEGLHGPNFYHVEFEDNSARDGIYPGEEYPNGYYTQMEKFDEEQKPAERNDCSGCAKHLEGYISGRSDAENKLLEQFGIIITPDGELRMKPRREPSEEPNIELIQKSWYMEGYHDCEFGYEPRWVIKTGEGGPRYEENPKYGQHLEQKPIEPSDEELQSNQDELYDFKVFAAKQAKEHRISFVHDFEWNNFCKELLSYFNEKQKPAEWSKNDTVFLNEITDFFENKTVRLQHDLDMYAHWLKSLPERFNPQPKAEWSEEDEDMIKRVIERIKAEIQYGDALTMAYGNQEISWLKSLRLLGNPARSR